MSAGAARAAPRSVRLYTHPKCLQHNPGSGHPESPRRLEAVLSALEQRFADRLPVFRPLPVVIEELRKTHKAQVLEKLKALRPDSGVAFIDGDTALSAGSWEAALLAAGAGIDAVDAVLAGDCLRAFCAVRPPGHHATAAQSMGFCLFNNIAIAAKHARELGIARVAIADFDVHHGNGTQDIFCADPNISYYSSHQSQLYPGTGDPTETGCGNIYNVGLPSGSGSIEFRQAWAQTLLPAMTAFAPDLVLVSAGFDAHYLDPLAGLAVTTEDFRWLSKALCEVANTSAQGRVVSMLEGGYNTAALADCAVAHVEALMD